jgi:RNA ligase (TIGR02306 family)
VENSDNLLSVKVICGKSGKWTGVINKNSGIQDGSLVEVYLPDAILPESNERFGFMSQRKNRVSIARFRGALSQVLIMPLSGGTLDIGVGESIAEVYGIKKYEKPVSGNHQQCGNFPEALVPKTDEPHFQLVTEFPLDWVATLKLDGTSMTILHNEGLWICSRNYRMKGGVYERAAEKIDTEKLRDKYGHLAIQGEVVGPGIQKNPSGAVNVEMRGFYVFDVQRQVFLSWEDTQSVLTDLDVAPVAEVAQMDCMCTEERTYLSIAESLVYSNGKPAEGIVVRPCGEMERYKNTFKYINPLYRD